jgi:hypothetical protein
MDERLALLRRYDPALVELSCGTGSVLLSPGLSGRIFCQLGGELLHRLDDERLQNPSADDFNNLGGNSLWPAPEGGPFAFNYPPGKGDWYVQDGVTQVAARVLESTADRAVMQKHTPLINRRGTLLKLTFQREVAVCDPESVTAGFDLEGVGYRCLDSLTPQNVVSVEDALFAAWSLEQFPGADGVIAFAAVPCPENSINFDYYGEPGERIQYYPGGFTFALGGADRHQIGVKVDSGATMIGALDTNRSLLYLRQTQHQEGHYFNIADNEQPDGPDSAADLYSVFNGGDLGFFELETVAPAQSSNGQLQVSQLKSQTTMLAGEIEELKRFLVEKHKLSFIGELP